MAYSQPLGASVFALALGRPRFCTETIDFERSNSLTVRTLLTLRFWVTRSLVPPIALTWSLTSSEIENSAEMTSYSKLFVVIGSSCRFRRKSPGLFAAGYLNLGPGQAFYASSSISTVLGHLGTSVASIALATAYNNFC